MKARRGFFIRFFANFLRDTLRDTGLQDELIEFQRQQKRKRVKLMLIQSNLARKLTSEMQQLNEGLLNDAKENGGGSKSKEATQQNIQGWIKISTPRKVHLINMTI